MSTKGQLRPVYLVAALALAALVAALIYIVVSGELKAGADMAMQLAKIR